MLPKAFIDRHEQTMEWHADLSLDALATLIDSAAEKAITWMEDNGGEPVIIKLFDVWTVVDAATESPKERRSCCYDYEARVGRKKNPPETSAYESIALYPGMRLMSELEYFEVQKLKSLDLKTSSWLHTPEPIRALGGAIFGDQRFGRVFIFHNTADCYYSSRGFRCVYPLEQQA